MTDDELRSVLAGVAADLVCVGHTQWPIDHRVEGIRVITSGSVSNPVALDLRASYALIDAHQSGYQIDLRRVPYSCAAVIDAVVRSRHPAGDFIISHFRGCVIHGGRAAVTDRSTPSPIDYGLLNLLSIKRGAGPFNRPTRLSVAPSGDLYVADGYGNARVPHSVWVHRDGRVFVCDRVQIFDAEGKLQTTWTNVTGPADLFIDDQERVSLGEMAWEAGTVTMAGRPIDETRPAQLSIRDIDGRMVTRWGGADPCARAASVRRAAGWTDTATSTWPRSPTPP